MFESVENVINVNAVFPDKMTDILVINETKSKRQGEN